MNFKIIIHGSFVQKCGGVIEGYEWALFNPDPDIRLVGFRQGRPIYA
jgi:hypothetical protein